MFQPGQSGNPNGRPKGSVNKQLQLLRQATELVLPLVLAKALSGDFEAQKLILQLGMPKLKPVEVPVAFDLPEDGTITPARAVLQQVADGQIALGQADKILNELVPAARKEEREGKPSGFMGAYLGNVMRG